MHFIEDGQKKYEDALAYVKQELTGLRTGRANPALVENVLVEAYGSKQPIKALGSITVSDPKTIVIQPWDKSLGGAIEKAIREANANLNPINDGAVVRVPIPALTEETRRDIVKILHQKIEEGRIQVRTIRDTVKNQIIDAERAKTISEDERYRLQEKLEKLVKEYNDKIRALGEEKEKEIMTV